MFSTLYYKIMKEGIKIMKNLLIKTMENTSLIEKISYVNNKHGNHLTVTSNFNIKNEDFELDNLAINELVIDGIFAYILTDIDLEIVLKYVEILTNSKDIVSVNIMNYNNAVGIFIYYRYKCDNEIMDYINKLYKNREYTICNNNFLFSKYEFEKFEVCKVENTINDIYLFVLDNPAINIYDTLMYYISVILSPIGYNSYIPINTGIYDNIDWGLVQPIDLPETNCDGFERNVDRVSIKEFVDKYIF